MAWIVRLHADFEEEVRALEPEVRIALAAKARLLEDLGPRLGRPHADVLKGSAFANMKELRFKASGGVWRVAFAFDPMRQAILLVAGDKSGGSQAMFYRQLIEKADQRYAQHLEGLGRR